jgi:PAS domain S-box-containing protein
MMRERQQGIMIQRLCEILAVERGYRDVWIAVLDPTLRVTDQAEAGTSRGHTPRAAGGEVPPCGQAALARRELVVLEDSPACPACVDARAPGERTIAVPIALESNLLGLLVAVTPAASEDDEERNLLDQIAGDAAFALHRFKLEAERSEVADALRVSEDLYRSLVETSPDSITMTDLTGRFIAANQRAAEAYGAADVQDFLATAPNAFEVIVPEDRALAAENMLRTLVTGKCLSLEYTLYRRDGTTYPAELNTSVLRDAQGNPRGFVGVSRDVTDRKRAEAAKLDMEEQLRHQQKLESLGTLASGVAHEINTPVNVVMNYAELTLREVGPCGEAETKIAGYAREIISESQRIAGIVRSLLSFARQDTEQRSPISVHELVQDVLSMMVGKVFDKDQIEVAVDVPADLPRVNGMRRQLEQVLINLLTNARDALNAADGPDRGAKRIAITARCVERDGRRWVRTTVEDRGAGIPRDVIGRIFEPFYTTKPTGTGLGLSVSHGIVTDHGGTLTAESREGEPTRVHMVLPAEE